MALFDLGGMLDNDLGLAAAATEGEEEKKKKAEAKPAAKKQTMGDEMRVLGGKNIDNEPAYVVAKRAAEKVGINPEMFFSSAFQEGMNKAIAKPNEKSPAYEFAEKGWVFKEGDESHFPQGTGEKLDTKKFPVDGFYNYGLDRFGERAPDLIKKGYLPKEFADKFKTYEARNEKGEKVKTAAFATNEDALMAKAAFMKDSMAKVQAMADKKGVKLDDDAKNYFTMVAYNAGEGNADKMLETYKTSADKKAFITSGDPGWQKIHKNISPRMENMKIAREMFNKSVNLPKKKEDKSTIWGTGILPASSLDASSPTSSGY